MHITSDQITLALSSAGIATFISSVFALVGQHLDRGARRRELIFKAAIEQAKQRVATVMEIVKINGGSTTVPDEAMLAGTYYRYFENLYDHGTLPQEAIDAQNNSKLEQEERESHAKETAKINNERVVTEAAKHPLTARQLLNSGSVSLLTQEQYEKLEQAASQSFP